MYRPRHRYSARRKPRIHDQARRVSRRRGPSASTRATRNTSPTSISGISPITISSVMSRRDVWERLFAGFKAETEKEHDEVVGLGGLHIVATERHDSRRIDNQLRGQRGTPGRSRKFALFPLAAGRSAAHFRRRENAESDAAVGHGRRCAHREQDDYESHSQIPGSRRNAEFRSAPNTCWNTTM